MTDDPLYPPMFTEDGQPFRDWVDFVDRVARPLVEARDDEATQAAMRLYRQASPYFICTALVMASEMGDTGESADDGAALRRAVALHEKAHLASWAEPRCVHCGYDWPCPTVRVASGGEYGDDA